MPKQPLALRIYTDPALTDLVRFVGFAGVAYPISKQDSARFSEKYGNDRMMKAADELIDYDTQEKLAKLKLDVRVHCRQLLGPLPEEWDSFYEGIENPPPNPYRKPACAPVTEKCAEPDARNSEAILRKLDDNALDELRKELEFAVKHHGPKSRKGKKFAKELEEAESEAARRRAEAGQCSEVDLIRSMHGKDLRRLLLNEHKHYRDYPPENLFHLEAIRRMDLLEAELRRRKNKVPDRPPTIADSIAYRKERIRNLKGVDLMQRYFKAKEVLEAEGERTGAWKQTKNEYDLLHAEIERRDIHVPPTGYDDPAREFRKHTTHRLKELLDMAEYELTKCELGSVTHEEATREIGFIEREIARRTGAA